MAAQDLNVRVIANNIANINTTAFKRARAESIANWILSGDRSNLAPR